MLAPGDASSPVPLHPSRMPHAGLTNTPRCSRQVNRSHFHLFDCPVLPRDPETFYEVGPERESDSAELTQQEELEERE